jgi:hypothetical protein
MCKLTRPELEIFCKAAKIISKKGHLEINAILRLIGSKDHKRDRKIIYHLFRLQLLKKHRANTYELTPIGRFFALDRCEWFGKYKR